jgi:hypothetical protein
LLACLFKRLGDCVNHLHAAVQAEEVLQRVERILGMIRMLGPPVRVGIRVRDVVLQVSCSQETSRQACL